MPIVETSSLRRAFGDVVAVEDLTLSIEAGEIFGLVGPDGAGKTTALRMLTTTLDPGGVEARVLGGDSVVDAEAIKRHIGYMSQRFGLYTDLSVLENLDFYADLVGLSRSERQERIHELLSRTDMLAFGDRPAGKLSGGMKQKLYLACTLLHRPELLFLDEPTFGVDPVSRRGFWDILNELVAEGLTAVVSTAYMDEAERCTRVAFMDSGRLIALGTPRELKERLSEPLLEVRTSRARQAMKHLETALPEGTVRLFGDRLHVLVDDPAEGRQTLERLFDDAELPLSSLRVVEPSLEDVLLYELQAGGDGR